MVEATLIAIGTLIVASLTLFYTLISNQEDILEREERLHRYFEGNSFGTAMKRRIKVKKVTLDESTALIYRLKRKIPKIQPLRGHSTVDLIWIGHGDIGPGVTDELENKLPKEFDENISLKVLPQQPTKETEIIRCRINTVEKDLLDRILHTMPTYFESFEEVFEGSMKSN